MTTQGAVLRRNGTVCAIKVFRQVAYLGTSSGRSGPSYGGWRYWCFICDAYEWSGRDVGTAMDGARRHYRRAHLAKEDAS